MSSPLFNSLLISIVFFVVSLNSLIDENFRIESLIRQEQSDVRLICDLNDVAWWKRPELLATRSGTILRRFRSKMFLEHWQNLSDAHVLHIDRLHSRDTGLYECETLGAIRLFNLTITVRLSTLELGIQLVSSDQSNVETSFTVIHGHVHLRENQLIRLTCVVARARPAAQLVFPFDIDYHLERNSTMENDDQTFQTILVLIFRIHRFHHQRQFFCQALQDNEQSVRSNALLFNVAYSPTCSSKLHSSPSIFTGLGHQVNLTCHMNHGNPAKINFTWHLPNGEIRLGEHLNGTSTVLTFIPKQTDEFGSILCRAQNELGLFGQCHLKMVLGAVPDPIESCRYTYSNSTLTVNCLAGFHQGDEEFFCYMYKRQENGSYSEHARLKGNCAFILPDLKPEIHHDFRVFTKNKYGDNFDRGYFIQVGKPRAASLAETTRIYWPYMGLFILLAVLISFVLICCSCQQLRKTIRQKRKTNGTNSLGLTYKNPDSHRSLVNGNGKSSSVHLNYPARPYRSKDQLISSESSTLPRTNGKTLKSFYSTDSDSLSTRRNTLKETDLDLVNGSVFPMINPVPLSIQRRPSFQSATKDPMFLFEKPFLKSHSRSMYSPERDLREREFFREKRRTYSPYPSNTSQPSTSFILENHYLATNSYSRPASNEHSWRENLHLERKTSPDNPTFFFHQDSRDENHFRNYDRDDGIFV